MSSFDSTFSKGSLALKKWLMGLRHDLTVLVAQTWTKPKTQGQKTSGQNRGISTTTVLLFTLAIGLFVTLGPDISCLSEPAECAFQRRANRAMWSRKGKTTTLPALDTSPKVALLFLASRGVPHEPLWRAFFERAAKLSFRHSPPKMNHLDKLNKEQKKLFEEISNSTERKLLQVKNTFNETVCPQEDELLLEVEVHRLMNPSEHSSQILAQQSLFSVYVHLAPNTTFPKNNTFYGKEVQNPVSLKKSWAKFNLVEAELRLMKTALKDKRNKKFVLLSETCIPLYPPEVIYSQLLSEKTSRMRSCGEQIDVGLPRYRDGLTGKYFNISDWRKNKQWFALNRAHVKAIVKETYLKNRFREYCQGYKGGHTLCISDEHYIASALFVYKFGNETDCVGQTTADVFHGGGHPQTFLADDMKQELLFDLRGTETCPSREAIESAAAIFNGGIVKDSCFQRNLSSLNIKSESDSSKEWVTARGYRPLNAECHLFARKFSADAVKETLRISLTCGGGSLGCWC